MTSRGAEHAGEMAVAAEEALVGHPGEHVLAGGDLDALLGLDQLVHAVVPRAFVNHPADVLVHDDDLAVHHDVLVAPFNGSVADESALVGGDVFVILGQGGERHIARGADAAGHLDDVGIDGQVPDAERAVDLDDVLVVVGRVARIVAVDRQVHAAQVDRADDADLVA